MAEPDNERQSSVASNGRIVFFLGRNEQEGDDRRKGSRKIVHPRNAPIRTS
jgi:hypothetical protein